MRLEHFHDNSSNFRYNRSQRKVNAMRSVKGTFQNGVAQPSEPVAEREGQPVIITFLDEGYASPPSPADDEAWSTLAQLVEDCAVETGIPDLAHQHDHYLYGKPKKA